MLMEILHLHFPICYRAVLLFICYFACSPSFLLFHLQSFFQYKRPISVLLNDVYLWGKGRGQTNFLRLRPPDSLSSNSPPGAVTQAEKYVVRAKDLRESKLPCAQLPMKRAEFKKLLEKYAISNGERCMGSFSKPANLTEQNVFRAPKTNFPVWAVPPPEIFFD